MEDEDRISGLDLSYGQITRLTTKMFIKALVVYGILWFFASDWMVVDFEDLWMPDASIGAAFGTVWFIFAWGLVMPIANATYLSWSGKYRTHEPGETFAKGLWISLHAGFFEELVFRWLLFFSAMVTIRFFNTITYGFVHWVYTEWLMPLANWATLEALAPQLVDHPEWLLGAALISANGTFRDGHGYLGFFGYVNSWFLGMVFFYLMLNYGLVAAILVHMVYDVCVFSAQAIGNAILPRNYLRPALKGYFSRMRY